MVFPFRSPSASKRSRRNRPSSPPAATEPVAAAPATAPTNRRLVSGERVLCRCALGLPKHDPFSGFRDRRGGHVVMNVRGGCLYLDSPLDDDDVERMFPRGESATVKGLTLYPGTGEPIVVGDVRVRFLKRRIGLRASGLVLRFVGLSEGQIDLLNALAERFPVVDGEEDAAIPTGARNRPGAATADTRRGSPPTGDGARAPVRAPRGG